MHSQPQMLTASAYLRNYFQRRICNFGSSQWCLWHADSTKLIQEGGTSPIYFIYVHDMQTRNLDGQFGADGTRWIIFSIAILLTRRHICHWYASQYSSNNWQLDGTKQLWNGAWLQFGKSCQQLCGRCIVIRNQCNRRIVTLSRHPWMIAITCKASRVCIKMKCICIWMHSRSSSHLNFWYHFVLQSVLLELRYIWK